jgi:hypothetical protein
MNFATEPTNHAVGIHEFGGPSVVGVIERAIPRPLSDEVLVRVHAATVIPPTRSSGRVPRPDAWPDSPHPSPLAWNSQDRWLPWATSGATFRNFRWGTEWQE